jgi:hypothetical protein
MAKTYYASTEEMLVSGWPDYQVELSYDARLDYLQICGKWEHALVLRACYRDKTYEQEIYKKVVYWTQGSSNLLKYQNMHGALARVVGNRQAKSGA